MPGYKQKNERGNELRLASSLWTELTTFSRAAFIPEFRYQRTQVPWARGSKIY